MNLAYDIRPEELELPFIKPATLQIRYNGRESVRDEKRIAFFRWDNQADKWVFLGGTSKENQLTVGITQFGRYALMEVDGNPHLSANEFLFTCQPRVFSPKQDQQATITFSLTEDAKVTLSVYNLDGRLQKSLVDAETMPPGRQAIVWDGKDKNGQLLPSGPYLIALTVGESKVNTKGVVILNL